MQTIETTALGDSIHAVYLLRKLPASTPIVVHERFFSLFAPLDSRIVAGPATQWPVIPGQRFQGPIHNEHIRDTMARCIGVEATTPGETLWSTEDRNDGPRVVICPHAARPHKEWTPSRWNELRDVLESMGLTVEIYEAPGRCKEALPLEQLHGRIRSAGLVIGVDSGHLHLADACGVPTLGLYGSTSAVTYGPYNQRARAIDIHRQQWMFDRPYNSASHLWRLAMDSITVEMVIDHLIRDFFAL